MEPENWIRIQTLFEELLDVPDDARVKFLEEHCVDEHGVEDAELRRTLEGMLDSSDIDDDFLVSPVEKADRHEPPRILGDFELIEELGRGGMGVVFRARQMSLGREVAVKVLPQGWFQTPRQIKRFQNESRAGGRLGHPGIITVFAEGQVDDVYYFAMELVEGPTLEQLIKARRSEEENPWPEESERLRHTADIAQLIAGVAEALDAAHSAGIVHRDVKPSNLIMDPSGLLKLGDFGLVLDDRSASMSLTGEVIGSPHYMSPEQAGGSAGGGATEHVAEKLADNVGVDPELDSEVDVEDAAENAPENAMGQTSNGVDHRTDIYSLGVVLYELLAGERPFRGEQVVEVLRDVVDAAPRPVRSVQPKVPHDLATICEVAMAKRPSERYATAGELAADLRRALALEPIKARPLPRIRRVVRWVRRHRAPLWTAAAVVASGATLGSLYVKQTRQIQIRDQLTTMANGANELNHDDWTDTSIRQFGEMRTEISIAIADLSALEAELRSDQQARLASSTEALTERTEAISLAGGDLITNGLSGQSPLEPWKVNTLSLWRGATLIQEARLLRHALGHDTSEMVQLVQKEWRVGIEGVDATAVLDTTEAPIAWLHEFDPETGIPMEATLLGPCPRSFFTSTGHFLLSIREPGKHTVEFDRVVWASSDVVEITLRRPETDSSWAPDMVKLDPEPVTYRAAKKRNLPIQGREFTLAPYWIERYEVSNDQYAEFVRAHPEKTPLYWDYSANVNKSLTPTERNFSDKWGRLPVVGITPLDARAYAEWRGLRLPTLPEQMYAARGPHGRLVPWVENDDWDGSYQGNCTREYVSCITLEDRFAEYLRNVVPVDEPYNSATADGICHLLGNVTEIAATLQVMPMGDEFQCSADDRMIFGGSWNIGSSTIRGDLSSAFSIMGGSSTAVSHRTGFRCARSE